MLLSGFAIAIDILNRVPGIMWGEAWAVRAQQLKVLQQTLLARWASAGMGRFPSNTARMCISFKKQSWVMFKYPWSLGEGFNI